VYHVETWREGKSITARVDLTSDHHAPFRFTQIESSAKPGHGTRVFGSVRRHLLAEETLVDAIGSKFIVDPSFSVTFNKKPLQLIGLHYATSKAVTVPDIGNIVVHRIDAPSQDRTIKLRGVTWWVNKKMVGQPSWEGFSERGAILDGRTQAAKRYSFIVEADVLKLDVKPDWTGFYESHRSIAVQHAVHDHVTRELDGILADSRRERKIEALSQQRQALEELPRISQRAIGDFVDQVQRSCPLLTDAELTKTVDVFTKMEKARTGYDLLHKLAAASPEDLDTWNQIMEQWTASAAEVVLSELKRRLDLIAELQELVNDRKTDELHQLQPLFGRGLWIFGPEYDSVEFTSNRQMATTVGQLLGGTDAELSVRRADFVVLPDRSVSVYAADQFEDGEVIGVRKVLVIELKRGGSQLTHDEVVQGQRYPLELQAGNAVMKDTEFAVYVLGSTVGRTAIETAIGTNIKITPLDYNTILRRAHGRTFNLHRKLSSVEPQPDPEVTEVLSRPIEAPVMFAGLESVKASTSEIAAANGDAGCVMGSLADATPPSDSMGQVDRSLLATPDEPQTKTTEA
jgi:hypothetical protein